MKRWIQRVVVFLVAGFVIAYGGDWAIYKLRGSPTDTVTVSLFVSAPLKNEKQEIDYIGQEQWTCTRSLFPFPPYQQNQSSPCWYLRKHTNQTTTY